VTTLADAYAAADTLAHVLGSSATLPTESHAVLTGLLIRMEERVDDLRAIASRESELAALRDAYQSLEHSKAADDTQHAAVQRALREAQAKLDALKSIEQTLESTTPQPAAGELEPKPDGSP
jgi:septal ring factor EnvC (AmiA/AmiB activator)